MPAVSGRTDAGTPPRSRTVVGLSLFWALQMATGALVQIYLAAHYGTGRALDVYLAGSALPHTFLMICSAACSMATVTLFHERKSERGHPGACEDMFRLGAIVGGIGAVTGLVFAAGAGPISRYMVPGFEGLAQQETASVLRITALALPLAGASAVLYGLLQATHHYYSSAVATIVQVAMLPVFLALGLPVDAPTLAWGFVASTAAWCIVLLASARRFGLIRAATAWTGPVWRRFVAVGGPVTFATMSAHGLWLLERHWGSFLDAGGMSALVYAHRVSNVLAGASIYGLATVLLPSLAEHLEAGDEERARMLNLRVLGLVAICAAVGASVFVFGSRPLVGLLFERGAFDSASTATTSAVLRMYVGVFVAHVVGAVVFRGAVAKGDGVVMAAGSVALLLVYSVLAHPMGKAYGATGLALAASIAFSVSLAVNATAMLVRHPALYRSRPAAAPGLSSSVVALRRPEA
jgi:putative peptidoglycan lipid II flippase